MITKIPLISPEDCDAIVSALNGYQWSPGESGSKEYAEKVKRNEELTSSEDGEVQNLLTKIATSIIKCDGFNRRMFPKHLARARFNRYQGGGTYGIHTDSAFMGSNPEIRTDVSMTVFLNDGYDGGALRLYWRGGEVTTIKEPKGTLVFYPSGVLHEVTPVVEGERIAFVAWAESHIRNPLDRELLSEVTLLADDVGKAYNQSEFHKRIINVKHELWRRFMWT